MEQSEQAASEKKLAVIGCGQMGGAILRGLLRSKAWSADAIRAFDTDPLQVERLKEGLRPAASAAEAAAGATTVVIAVKPKIVGQVLSELNTVLRRGERPLVVSIAGGVSLSQLKAGGGEGLRLSRAMPNIACMVGAGSTAVYAENGEDLAAIEELFAPLGWVERVRHEAEFDVLTGLSGCGPGFISVVIEALADGAVKMGLERERATRLAAHTVLGTAAVVSYAGIHPAIVKEMVASPGGMTIAGLHVLEKERVRAAMMSAVEASTRRARE